MEYQTPNPSPYNQGPFRDLPNATLALVLGIISIVMGCCFAPIGLILAIIAMVQSSKDMKLYNQNPDLYSRSSYNNLNAGRICAIIGLILSILGTVYIIFVLATGGSMIWQQYKEILHMRQHDADESMLYIIRQGLAFIA